MDRNPQHDVRRRSLDLVEAAGVGVCGDMGEELTEFTRYRDIRNHLRDGDLVLFRGDPAGLIAAEGRAKHSHAGLLAWRRSDQDTLLVAESRELKGSRLVTLSSQIRAYPGCIDVYRPTYQCPQGVRTRAATIAVNWAGKAYGYPTAARMTLMHTPILRRLWQWWSGEKFEPTDVKLSPWDEPKVCSQLVAWAYRWAINELSLRIDWDACPGLGDRWIEPGDLARSGSFRMVAKGLVI